MQSVGIIGLGSIGRRHARLLASLVAGVRIHAYRTRKGALLEAPPGVVDEDREAFFSSRFDLVIIANPSALHLQTLREVVEARLAPTILVEKPFCLPDEVAEATALVARSGSSILPGNCLRFHPAIALLKATLESGDLGNVVECHAHFGTYMPGWHPYEDYRATYAARRDLGGGVLMTSIHELDLVHHLFGDGRVVAAYVGRLALPDIDVEDSAHLLLSLSRCRLANISLNFFERPADRFLKVIFERGVWSWRFGEAAVAHVRWNDGSPVHATEAVDPGVDAMYVNMWRAVLAGQRRDFELASVFASLRTAEAARRIGEADVWT